MEVLPLDSHSGKGLILNREGLGHQVAPQLSAWSESVSVLRSCQALPLVLKLTISAWCWSFWWTVLASGLPDGWDLCWCSPSPFLHFCFHSFPFWKGWSLTHIFLQNSIMAFPENSTCDKRAGKEADQEKATLSCAWHTEAKHRLLMVFCFLPGRYLGLMIWLKRGLENCLNLLLHV